MVTKKLNYWHTHTRTHINSWIFMPKTWNHTFMICFPPLVCLTYQSTEFGLVYPIWTSRVRMTSTDRRGESRTSSVARKALVSPFSDWLSKNWRLINMYIINIFHLWSYSFVVDEMTSLFLFHTDLHSQESVSELFSCPWRTAAFRRTPYALCTAGVRPKVGST